MSAPSNSGGYIGEVARDPGPGQAVLFGTTPAFLEKMGLDSLAQLPAIATFVPGADVVEALEHGLRMDAATAPAAADPTDRAEREGQTRPHRSSGPAEHGIRDGRPTLDELLDGGSGGAG